MKKFNFYKSVIGKLATSTLILTLIGCGSPGGTTDTPKENSDDPTILGLVINGDFESGASNWGGNAANVENIGNNNVNSSNNEVAADPWDVNLQQVLSLTAGKNYQLTFKAKSDRSRSLIVGIGMNEEPYTNSSSIVNLSTTWQTFTKTLSASGFGGSNSRVYFEMGGDAGQIYLDDVSLEELSTTTCDGSLNNGNFERGQDCWSGNAANVVNTDNNNSNFSSNDKANNPWDVNLQQQVTLVEGSSYELSFRAKSDRSRTMIAGIGLNEQPYTDDKEVVTMNTSWQTFTLNLTASGFGGNNSRVYFDMGDDAGEIYLDDVSLTVQ